ncbi:MAG: hypothetical protein NXH75_06645 [Halobacteriovoraceae bacterium]|nr:hypothetical protein [Halobacteriovoraceae bacterium]
MSFKIILLIGFLVFISNNVLGASCLNPEKEALCVSATIKEKLIVSNDNSKKGCFYRLKVENIKKLSHKQLTYLPLQMIKKSSLVDALPLSGDCSLKRKTVSLILIQSCWPIGLKWNDSLKVVFTEKSKISVEGKDFNCD